MRILTEPKNAVIRQFEYLFALDNVKLEFTEDALREIAKLAVKRDTGARGLRSIVEGFMQKVMFEIPSMDDLERCVISREVVLGEAEPEYFFNENRPDIRPDKKGREPEQLMA